MSAARIFNQRTHWEAEGVPRALGTRFWQPGEEPPASAFDWWFYSTYKDIEDLAFYLQEHAGAKLLTPEAFTLAGPDAARMGILTDAGVPALIYDDGVVGTAMVALKTSIPSGNSHIVTLWWTGLTANPRGDSVAWNCRYGTVAVNASLNATLQHNVQVAPPHTNPLVLAKTTFEVPSPGAGYILLLWLCRDGESGMDTYAGQTAMVCVEVS